AEQGHPTTWFSTLQIALGMRDLVRNSEASAIFLPDGAPPLPERHLPLPALARTLRILASDGPDSFYSGVLAETIVADLQAGGSRIDLDDLKGYQVVEPSSLQTRHRGTDIHTAGPTSGGPRLIEALAHIETHLDRREGLSPANWKVYANALEKAWQIHKRKIKRTTEIGSCTSHLSTVDADGNMVALTYTLLNRFGSCVLLPRSGILMNNAVSYFDPRPGFPTTMTGGKRINASNMCPIIATRDDQARFAIGASGANHIMPCTTQIAAMMLDFGFGLEQAFNHGRIDASDRGSIRVDPRLGEEVLTALGEDFELEVAQRLVFPKLYSCPSGVSRDPNSGRCLGMNDPSQPIGGAAPPAPFRLDQTRQVDQPRA
ncbi:MAG: gamma-glutamyltransferase, partial [Geminicoccaceae bacterium]